MTPALALMACLAAPPQLDFQPAQTYAVIAGVLQWPGNRIHGFPTKNRKDEELYDVLRARGVPADNMALLLDEQATYSGIKRAMKSIASKAPADATLIVYYCGHGSPCGKGEVCFANYDLVPQFPQRTGLLASDLTAMVRDSFKGKRVLFLADCCFSGALAKPAEDLAKAGMQTAALTSTDASMVSTENWTFTQAVIDALNGDPLDDANGDGIITLAELAAEVQGAMNGLEQQKHGYAAFALPAEFKLSVARGEKPKAVAGAKYTVGQFVVAADGSTGRAGRVMTAGADGKYGVQFYDYTEKRRVELQAEKLAPLPADWVASKGKPIAAPGAAQKAEILVEWKGKWYPAVVLKKDGEKTYVHYVGDTATWDEWVTKDRIKELPPPAAGAGPLANDPAKAECLVEWQGQWFPATTLKKDGEKTLIHYVGWADTWDEWVPKDRIKPMPVK